MKNSIWIGMVLGLGTLVALGGSLAQAREPGLERVLERTRRVVESGGTPYVVMDLDETVIDSRARRRMAYSEAARDLCATSAGPGDLCATLTGLNTGEIYRLANGYDAAELAIALGVESRDVGWIRIVAKMEELYLSGRYEDRDEPVPGANLYVQALRRAGAKIVYVSSRFEIPQRKPTLLTLRTFGMLEAEADVMLRPTGMSSIEFKRWAFGRVSAHVHSEGRNSAVVGAFENEPENLRAMGDAFRDAELVFVEGAAFSSGALPPGSWRIQGYR